MSWIGITDLNLNRSGNHARSRRLMAPLGGEGLLTVGTLMAEFTMQADPEHGQVLFDRQGAHGWVRAFRLHLCSDGRLDLNLRQGPARASASLAMAPPAPGERLRITVSWDAPGRWGLITAENLDREMLFQADIAAPPPLPTGDARALLDPVAYRGTAIRFVALSDRIEPVGLPAGFLRGTRIGTLAGPVAIEDLRAGDLLPTASGQLRKVLWMTRRDVPALGRFRPVRLRAPYFGLTGSVCVAPDHRMQLTRAEAEYLFGEDTVLIQARDLVDGRAAQRLPGGTRTLTYYHILLDEHDCVESSGMWGESLFVGALARQPDMLLTTPLAGLPAGQVPRHRHHAHAHLTSREAHSLSMAIAS